MAKGNDIGLLDIVDLILHEAGYTIFHFFIVLLTKLNISAKLSFTNKRSSFPKRRESCVPGSE